MSDTVVDPAVEQDEESVFEAEDVERPIEVSLTPWEAKDALFNAWLVEKTGLFPTDDPDAAGRLEAFREKIATATLTQVYGTTVEEWRQKMEESNERPVSTGEAVRHFAAFLSGEQEILRQIGSLLERLSETKVTEATAESSNGVTLH